MALSKLIPILTILMCLGVSIGALLIYRGLKDQPAILDTEVPIALATPVFSDPTTETFFVFDSPAPSPLPHATSTPRPTSTPIDYGDLPITQTAVQVLVIADTAQAGIVQANGTQNALDIAKGNAIATQGAIGTSTAWAVATSDEKIRVNNANSEYALGQQKARDNLEIAVAWVWKVGGSILLIVATILVMLFIFYRAKLHAHRKAVETISDNFLENIQAPVVQTSLDTHSGAEHAVAMTAAEILILKRAVVDLNGILSRRRIIDGEYFKRVRWQIIHDDLLRKDINEIAFFETLPSGAITPTEEGWKWLKLTPPTSPQVQKSIENSQERGTAQPVPTQPASAHLAKQESL